MTKSRDKYKCFSRFFLMLFLMYSGNSSVALPLINNLPLPMSQVVQVTIPNAPQAQVNGSGVTISSTTVTGVINTISNLGNSSSIIPMTPYQGSVTNFLSVQNTVVGGNLPNPLPPQPIFSVKVEKVKVIDEKEIVTLSFGNDPLIAFGVSEDIIDKNARNNLQNGAVRSQLKPTQASRVLDKVINTNGIPEPKSILIKNGELILSASTQREKIVRIKRVAMKSRQVLAVQGNGVGVGVIGKGTGINNPRNNATSNGLITIVRNGVGAGVIGEGTGINNPTVHNDTVNEPYQHLATVNENGVGMGILGKGTGINHVGNQVISNPSSLEQNTQNLGTEVRSLLITETAEIKRSTTTLSEALSSPQSRPDSFIIVPSVLGGGRIETAGVDAGLNHSPNQPTVFKLVNHDIDQKINKIIASHQNGVGLGIFGDAKGINNPSPSVYADQFVILGMNGLGVGLVGEGTGIDNSANPPTSPSSNSTLNQMNLISVQGNGTGLGILGTATGINNAAQQSESGLISIENNGLGIGVIGSAIGINNSHDEYRDNPAFVVMANNGVGTSVLGDATGINNRNLQQDNGNSNTTSQRSLISIANNGVGLGVLGTGTGINNTRGDSETYNNDRDSVIAIENNGFGFGAGGSGTGINNQNTMGNDNAQRSGVVAIENNGVGTGILGEGTGINNQPMQGVNNTSDEPNQGGPLLSVRNNGVGTGVIGTGTGINNMNTAMTTSGNASTEPLHSNGRESVTSISNNGVGTGVIGEGTGINNDDPDNSVSNSPNNPLAPIVNNPSGDDDFAQTNQTINQLTNDLLLLSSPQIMPLGQCFNQSFWGDWRTHKLDKLCRLYHAEDIGMQCICSNLKPT